MTADIEIGSGRSFYRYYVAWTISGDLALELNFTGVSWSMQIRKAGTFQGSLIFESDERLAEAYWGTMPGKMSIYVTRNNVPVWGGFVSRRTYDPVTRQIDVEATGFEAYAYRRTIWHTLAYDNTYDQYQVVRELMAIMQTDFSGLAVASDIATSHPDSANLGITVDSRNSSKHQDSQTWLGYELTTFGDAIENFSNNLGGFEYNIEIGWNLAQDTFTKRLVFRDTPPSQLPDGDEYVGERPGLEENFFEYPGNIMTLGYDDTIDEAADRYFVTGKQPESAEVAEGEESVEEPTPRGVYENEAYFSTQWPIFEAIESSEHSEVSLQETLNNYAQSYGQRVKPPIPAWNVTVNGGMNPHVGSYRVGDWCRFIVTDPFLSQALESTGTYTESLTKRIAQFTVDVPDQNQIPETVTLTLIDEWSDEGM